MKIDAVIFDVDGTILDTREFIAQGFEHSLLTHGHKVPPRSHVMATVAGIPVEECFATLAPDGDILALCGSLARFQSGRFDLVVAYDGLYEVLQALREKKILLGLCTSRSENLHQMLAHTKTADFFDAVISADDVQRHKPDPEGLLKALTRLDVAPERAVMVGDTVPDIKAGKAAKVGMTIGVTHGFGSHETLSSAGADHVIDSLRDLSALIS